MRESYAAGIIDGEGIIGISRRASITNKSKIGYLLTVQVSMKMPTLVPGWLLANFGGNYGEYKQGKNAWGTGMIAKWSIHGSEAQKFIDEILPFLIDKKEHAKLALTFPITSSSHHKSEEGIQEVVWERISKLQRKGIIKK